MVYWNVILTLLILHVSVGKFNVVFDSSVSAEYIPEILRGVNLVDFYIVLHQNVSISFYNISLNDGVIADTYIPNFCFDNQVTYALIPIALYAQKYNGSQYCADPQIPHMEIRLSSKLSFSTSRSISENEYDLVGLVAHEICHGLGFTSLITSDGTFIRFTYPTLYDTIVLQLPNSARLTDTITKSLTGNALQFPFSKHYPLYSKNPFRQGTSIIHGFYGLMRYKCDLGVAQAEMDVYTLLILQRLGLTVRNCDTPDTSTICNYCRPGTRCIPNSAPRMHWMFNKIFI